MRILQICSYLYPALNYGGPAKMVFDLSSELSINNNDVTIYTTDVWDQSRRILRSEQLKRKKHLHVKYFKNIFNGLAFKLRLFTGFGMVSEFFTEYKKFDVVHIHDVFIIPQLLIALSAIWLKKPLFLTPHGILDPVRLQRKTIIKRLLLPIVYFVFKLSTQIIAVSKKEENDLKKLGFNKIVTIYNGIPELEVLPSKKFAGLTNNKKITLLYIGKIHPQKGLKEALVALKKSNLDAQFIIAGPNDGGKKELDEIIERYTIPNVYLIGYVNDSEKKELYQMSDLFVHPSYAEGFSISILEALQEGLPVLITDGCNFPEVELNKAGYIAKVENLETNIHFLFNLIANNSTHLKDMGNNGIKLVKNRYTVSLMSKQTYLQYEKYV